MAADATNAAPWQASLFAESFGNLVSWQVESTICRSVVARVIDLATEEPRLTETQSLDTLRGRRSFQGANYGLDPQWRAFAERAKQVYDETLKLRLEPEHVGELIAVEPDSKEFLLASTINEMNQSTRLRFGTKPVHIFGVGGGAAVKIGVGPQHARHHVRHCQFSSG